MSSTLQAMQGRAEHYATETPYRYGRALELSGQAVESLYTKSPNPLGVGISGRLSVRIVAAVVVSAIAIGVGIAGISITHAMSGPSGAPSGFGPPAGLSSGFGVLFGLVALVIAVVAWVPVISAFGDLKVARAMVERGQQLMAGGSLVDTKDIEDDLTQIWGQAMNMLAWRTAMNQRAAMYNRGFPNGYNNWRGPFGY